MIFQKKSRRERCIVRNDDGRGRKGDHLPSCGARNGCLLVPARAVSTTPPSLYPPKTASKAMADAVR